MDVVYKNYEPNKGFEELQAKIYNEAVKPYDGATVTPEQIKSRFEADKPDFQGIRYALKPDGSPLAYIQYRYEKKDNEIHIGYPWATAECAPDVQEKLYSEELAYVKSKYSGAKILMGYISNSFSRMHDFAKRKGFVVNDVEKQFEFDIKSAIKVKVEGNKPKLATMEDLETLVTLGTSDTELEMSKDYATSYFKGRVIPQGNCIILSKDAKPVAACAALKAWRKETSLIRFTAIAPGNESLKLSLYAELAKHLMSVSWEDKKLVFNLLGKRDYSDLIKKLGAKEVSKLTEFRLEEKPKK